jgi:hypothetical protein
LRANAASSAHRSTLLRFDWFSTLTGEGLALCRRKGGLRATRKVQERSDAGGACAGAGEAIPQLPIRPLVVSHGVLLTPRIPGSKRDIAVEGGRTHPKPVVVGERVRRDLSEERSCWSVGGPGGGHGRVIRDGNGRGRPRRAARARPEYTLEGCNGHTTGIAEAQDPDDSSVPDRLRVAERREAQGPLRILAVRISRNRSDEPGFEPAP